MNHSLIRKLGMVVVVALVVGCGAGQGSQGDFREGVDAARRGDYATALKEWGPFAEQGNAIAQYNLGVMYAKGQGVPKDYKLAVKWYRKSAEQGDPSAQSNLGLMYEN